MEKVHTQIDFVVPGRPRGQCLDATRKNPPKPKLGKR